MKRTLKIPVPLKYYKCPKELELQVTGRRKYWHIKGVSELIGKWMKEKRYWYTFLDKEFGYNSNEWRKEAMCNVREGGKQSVSSKEQLA